MNNFFAELKRRNVLRAAAAYAVVAWIIVQVAVATFPPLGFPGWALTMVIVLSISGFPITLAISWFYEWTPKGFQTQTEADAAGYEKSQSFGRLFDFVVIALLVVAVGWLVYRQEFQDPAISEASIAVLPFVNMSGDAANEYFSDGISEELLNGLAKIPDLRVAARTSSFRFKGENRDAIDIGQQLNVSFILEGSVRKSGNQVRITAQLIDATTGFHLWSDSYDQELADIFAVQDEISASIVEELKTTMGLEVAVGTLIEAIKTSPEAYDAYLLGIYEMEKRGSGPLAEAVQQFEKALEIDPDYAPAMARLAITYILLTGYDFSNYPDAVMLPKALPFIERAMALAPNLPEAQAAKGLYMRVIGDYLEAEAYFRRALEFNPSYTTVRTWLANLMASLGRYDVQLEMLELVVRDDPLSRLAVNNLADAYQQRKMFEKAAPLIERLRSLSPLFYHIRTANTLEAEGRFPEAAMAWLEALKLGNSFAAKNGFSDLLESQFGLCEEHIRFGWFPWSCWFASGQEEKVLRAVADLEKQSLPDDIFFKSNIGAAYLFAGETEKAGEHLEGAWDLLPDRPNKIDLFTPLVMLSFVEFRKQTGDLEGVRELIDLSNAYIDNREAGNVASSAYLRTRGFLLLYEGRVEEGLEYLNRAIEDGYFLEFRDYYFMSKFPEINFDPVTAVVEERQVRERDKFLTIFCNGGNPAPEIWTPLSETCEGYVQAANG